MSNKIENNDYKLSNKMDGYKEVVEIDKNGNVNISYKKEYQIYKKEGFQSVKNIQKN